MDRSVCFAVLLIFSLTCRSWGRVEPTRTLLKNGRALSTQLQAQAAPAQLEKLPGITQKTAGFEKLAGYFNLYWDARQGKLWLEIGKWNTEFLYVDSLPQGVGSNDIGLDRGQPGESRVVEFERVGPKVLLIQSNYSFRAVTNNPDERRTAEEAFAQSTLWGFTVAAEDGDRALVDATDFFLHDAHNVAAALKRTQQGSYSVDPSRSAIYLPRTKSFPRNTEVESTLTFTGQPEGDYVREVVPSPQAVTVREHYSFVQLPDDGYTPRAYDPRAGYFDMRYMDFATPLDQPIVKRFTVRHRLKKKDPTAAVSEAAEPLIYYVDRGAPEPIRSALVEGASWWNQAFEAAGYKDAFQVKVLPEGVDPMDVRYNVIQWVDRSSRGWAYGSAIIDPRTGEIIKGQVTLDALRARQDFMIAEGLLAPYQEGGTGARPALDMVLARIRQLSAHETGHTLGLAHNFAASTHDRASVMDYPGPLVKLSADGGLDVSDAYASGVGEWDKVAVAYGYQDFAPGTNEKQELDGILEQSIKRGLYFISDADARPFGGAHPAAHLWDNGEDAVAELDRIMQVRQRALSRFGVDNIPVGAPMSTLENTLVPIYLYHRYQTEAAAKVLGGLDYRYALRGDGQRAPEIAPPAEQRRALTAVLKTISPQALELPEAVLRLIPPPAMGYERSREDFTGRTGLVFDALGPPEAAASLTVGLILDPQRDSRLMENHGRDPQAPSLAEVMDQLLSATWKAPQATGYQAEIQRTVDNVMLDDLMLLAANQQAAPQVRALASAKLTDLKDWLYAGLRQMPEENRRAQFTYAISEIEHFEKDPKSARIPVPVEPPPGQPIGNADEDIGDGATE
jgi:Met-zincin/Domain of unknown function (DUF5117)